MTLSPVIGMDGDLVDERAGRPLGADQDADRVGAREGDHAAAAPDLKVADRPLERGRRHRRLVGKVRRPAAIQRVDEKPDVVRCGRSGTPTSPSDRAPDRDQPGEARRAISLRRGNSPADGASARLRLSRLRRVRDITEAPRRPEPAPRRRRSCPWVGRDHLGHHLLADLDAILDERKIDGARRARARAPRSAPVSGSA